MVFIDNEAYALQLFIQAVSANTVLEDALDDGRAFGALKKFLLLVHRADEIPVGRTQRKDEIKKKDHETKKKFKNMSLFWQKLCTTFHKKMNTPGRNPT